MPVHETHQAAPSPERPQGAVHLPELRPLRPYLGRDQQALTDDALWRALQEQLLPAFDGDLEQLMASLQALVTAASQAAGDAYYQPGQGTCLTLETQGQAEPSPVRRQGGCGALGQTPAAQAQPATTPPAPTAKRRPQRHPEDLSALVASSTQQALANALIPLWLVQAGVSVAAEQRLTALSTLNAYRHLLDQVYVNALANEMDPNVVQAVEQSVPQAQMRALREAHHRSVGHHGDASEALCRLLAPRRGAPTRLRSAVRARSAHPFSALCQLRVRHGNHLHLATGCYVGHGLILTSGDALYNAQEGWASEVLVSPGRHGLLQQPSASFVVASEALHVHPRWAQQPEGAAYNLGLLRVHTAPPFARFVEAANKPRRHLGQVGLCGYGQVDNRGTDPNRLVLEVAQLQGVGADVLAFQEDAGRGLPGAPVFEGEHGRVTLIAVNGRDQGTKNQQACRITESKLAFMRQVQESGRPSAQERPLALDLQQGLREATATSHSRGNQPTGWSHELSVHNPNALDALEELGVFQNHRDKNPLRVIRGGIGS